MDWLRPRAPQFAEFTFDHQLNGVVVGEQGDNRELFALTVVGGVVSRSVLRQGDPMPGESDFAGFVEDRPWLAGERPQRWSTLRAERLV